MSDPHLDATYQVGVPQPLAHEPSPVPVPAQLTHDPLAQIHQSLGMRHNSLLQADALHTDQLVPAHYLPTVDPTALHPTLPHEPPPVLDPSPTPAPPPHHPVPKKQRRRYDNNFKAEVLDHLKTPGTKLPTVAKQYGIPENTLREWTKVRVVQSIESARANQGGALKANMVDPLQRLTESLMVFFDRNDRQPQHMRQPVTTKLVVAKGLESRNNLLELHEIQPFLEDRERKALEAFTGSDSWAKKFARRHNLKMTGARVKDLEDDDVRTYSLQLRQMASRVKQAGPGYEEVSGLLKQVAEKLVAARIIAARRARQAAPPQNSNLQSQQTSEV